MRRSRNGVLSAPSSEFVGWLRAALLGFFDSSARALPWRRTLTDPYSVWVSEIMAQQTRVETVVPYYQRWMQRFPDLMSLADAPFDDVLKLWEGLGYYSRARNLHAAARVVRERYAGDLPGTYDALRALPGIGEYTAGAVSSIAFGERRAAVDGNVRRVLARLFDEPAPTIAWLRRTAAALVPEKRPGDFNQSLMDLGARICTPRAPRCPACPLAQLCRARAAGTQLQRPRARRSAAPPLFIMATAVVRAGDRALLIRRPATGQLAGMWSFPAQAVSDVAAAPAAALDIVRRLVGDVPRDAPAPLGTIDHAFSHRRERYVCFLIDSAGAQVASAGADRLWLGADRSGVILPRAQQRIHTLALAALHPVRARAPVDGTVM